MRVRPLIVLLAFLLVVACGAAQLAPVTPPTPPLPTPDASAEKPSPIVVTDAAPPDAGASTPRVKYRGVNLAGAEFGKSVPGILGKDYAWPTKETADYFIDRGFNFIRLPFRHERIQRETKGPLDETYRKAMEDFVAHATGRGVVVAIEPHNSARFGIDCDPLEQVDPRCRLLTETEMGDIWGRLAATFRGNLRVWFDLTNEPHNSPTETWVKQANAGIKEIRRVGASNTILAPGNGWSGAMNWDKSWYGTPNTVAMLGVIDPLDNMIYEAHQYMNANGSGAGVDCVSATVGVERIRIFVEWLRANGRRGFIGEIGAKDTPTCQAAIVNALRYIEASADVLAGWAWWAAGHRWQIDYALSLQPLDGGARPQMAWLAPFLDAGAR